MSMTGLFDNHSIISSHGLHWTAGVDRSMDNPILQSSSPFVRTRAAQKASMDRSGRCLKHIAALIPHLIC